MRLAACLLCITAMLVSGCAGTAGEISSKPAIELLETYWRPLEIDGKPVSVQAGTREPHVILRGEGTRITGFTGCNSLAGGFKHDSTNLNFGPLITTRMACVPEAGNVLEAAFTTALQSTASYRIVGESLELRDTAGVTRIRLEARYLR